MAWKRKQKLYVLIICVLIGALATLFSPPSSQGFVYVSAASASASLAALGSANDEVDIEADAKAIGVDEATLRPLVQQPSNRQHLFEHRMMHFGKRLNQPQIFAPRNILTSPKLVPSSYQQDYPFTVISFNAPGNKKKIVVPYKMGLRIIQKHAKLFEQDRKDREAAAAAASAAELLTASDNNNNNNNNSNNEQLRQSEKLISFGNPSMIQVSSDEEMIRDDELDEALANDITATRHPQLTQRNQQSQQQSLSQVPHDQKEAREYLTQVLYGKIASTPAPFFLQMLRNHDTMATLEPTLINGGRSFEVGPSSAHNQPKLVSPRPVKKGPSGRDHYFMHFGRK